MSLLIDQHTKNSYTYVKTFLQILIHVIHSLKVILTLKVKIHLYIPLKNKMIKKNILLKLKIILLPNL